MNSVWADLLAKSDVGGADIRGRARSSPPGHPVPTHIAKAPRLKPKHVRVESYDRIWLESAKPERPEERPAPRTPPPAAQAPRPSLLKAWVLLCTGLVAWSSLGPLYRLLPPDLQQRPFRIALWRYAIGLVPLLAATSRTPRAPHWRCVPPAAGLAASTLGGFAFYSLSIRHCEQFVLAAGMCSLNPFLLLLYELSCGRSIGRWNSLGLGLGGISMMGMAGADRLTSSLGILHGLVASSFFTLYGALSSQLRDELPFRELMAFTFGIGALLSFAVTAVLEGTTLQPGPESLWSPFTSVESFVLVIVLGLVYSWGLLGLTSSAKALPALVVAVAIALEPLSSVLIVFLFQQETPQPWMAGWLSCLAVASAVVGAAAVGGDGPEGPASDGPHRDRQAEGLV